MACYFHGIYFHTGNTVVLDITYLCQLMFLKYIMVMRGFVVDIFCNLMHANNLGVSHERCIKLGKFLKS